MAHEAHEEAGATDFGCVTFACSACESQMTYDMEGMVNDSDGFAKKFMKAVRSHNRTPKHRDNVAALLFFGTLKTVIKVADAPALSCRDSLSSRSPTADDVDVDDDEDDLSDDDSQQ